LDNGSAFSEYFFKSEKHAKTQTWEMRPGSIGNRAGLHGTSYGYGGASDKSEMISLIRSAVERGVTMFDTAEAYGPFANEELVGEALASFREQVAIATKFGFNIQPNGQRSSGLNSRPEHIKGCRRGGARRRTAIGTPRRRRNCPGNHRRGRSKRRRSGCGFSAKRDPGGGERLPLSF
jgi:hypothetical protein